MGKYKNMLFLTSAENRGFFSSIQFSYHTNVRKTFSKCKNNFFLYFHHIKINQCAIKIVGFSLEKSIENKMRVYFVQSENKIGEFLKK